MDKPPKPEQPGYTVAGAEKIINTIISFVFYYRLGFIFVGFVLMTIFGIHIWQTSLAADQLKNIAIVFTCGSIIVAIFYSILNYEYTQIRFKHDKKLSKEILTFTVASEWHKNPMAEYCKIASKFLNKCKPLIQESNATKFHAEIEDEANEEAKKALLSIFNYFESISLGLKQGIMDEDFIKGFFLTSFKQYYTEYSFYIDHRRKVRSNPKIWNNFTILANNWLNY